MKATRFYGLLFSLTILTWAQAADAPAEPVNQPETTPAVADEVKPSAPALAQPAQEESPPPLVVGEGEKGLRMNFRGVPLEMVLNYLSEAAGFVIVLEAEVKGKVDAWSNTPLTKEEAVDLLDTVLNKNGYAAIRNGRTLSIVSRDEAKKRNIPVRSGNRPEDIPNTDEMVTQIIPVRYANAVQMTKDLQPLLPTHATLTANESGNALVLTDTQSDIRRMVEIVKALDTSISGISTIRVFPLRYGDAKDLANEIRELFPAPPTTGRGGGFGNNPLAMFAGRFGGGPGGGPGGAQGGAAAAGTGASEARQAASRVTAVADERTNSLIVSAPEEVMPTIEQLVKEIDTNAENITELRVFPLKYSDPQEMADILSELFPDDTRTDTTRSQVQFGGPGFGRGGGPGGFFARAQGAGGQQAASSRARQKGRVVAVADARTTSVIVSAASDLMPQIAEMIAQLDANPARKQKVFVYSLENADVDSVQQVLQDMFQSQYSRTSTGSRQTGSNPLATRQQNQGYGNTGTGFGTSTGTRGGTTGARRIGN